jgi:pullulanase-type alpha-1,6-glucosidase
MAGTGIGSFSDRLRDAARGGGPFSGIQEQGFLTGLWLDPNGITGGSPADQLARLLLHMDQIRVGLAGNLADYVFVDRFGNTVTGAQVDYNGQPAGYTDDPQEVIGYVAAHDNETLFDAVQLKAPAAATVAERARMQRLGLSLVSFSQGVPFWHAGMDLLRSKSLDRNSYDSGDWFNKLDFTYQTNNWGVGLPPERDNGGNWPVMAPLLADPALAVTPADVEATAVHAREVLAIRRSTPLFRLRTGGDVIDRVRFHNTGPGQVPGLIVMSVHDDEGAVDRGHEHLVVAFNAGVSEVAFDAPALAGLPLALHPVHAASADPVVREAGFAPATGTLTVPARTAAVFWAERPAAEQVALLIADVEALVAAGALNGGQGHALIVKLEGVLARLAAGQTTPAVNRLEAFVHQVEDFVAAGVLTAEEGQALLDAAAVLLAQLAG